jgi:hypothetical protein
MPISGAASGPPGPAAATPASCCLPCTGWRHWPSDGCWAPTRARSTPPTCPPTWMSSSSGSTGAAHPAAVWSSTGYWSWPPGTIRSASRTCCRQETAASAARERLGPPAEPGTPRGESAMKNRRTPAAATHPLRLSEYPLFRLSAPASDLTLSLLPLPRLPGWARARPETTGPVSGCGTFPAGRPDNLEGFQEAAKVQSWPSF